jgi:heat-inducible transcriptional repressor
MRVLKRKRDMLSDRSEHILKAIVRTYIAKGEPVGSRYLSKQPGFTFSPATIRNVMADLEEMGYLWQPHTSAGRVPTDTAYRFYVDSLGHERLGPDARLLSALARRFRDSGGDFTQLLEGTIRTVSDLSRHLSFAIALKPEGTTLNRLQLYRYRGSQTVAVVLTDEGLIANRILDSDFGLSQQELNRIADYLNAEFTGHTLDDIRVELRRQISQERRRHDLLVAKAVEICREALRLPGGDLILAGIPELLGLPEFSDRINRIARAIEDKQRMVNIMDRVAGAGGGLTVLIGSENSDRDLEGMTIIKADYAQKGRPLGSVGIIGPTRMDYRRTIPLVSAMARFVSEAFERN